MTRIRGTSRNRRLWVTVSIFLLSLLHPAAQAASNGEESNPLSVVHFHADASLSYPLLCSEDNPTDPHQNVDPRRSPDGTAVRNEMSSVFHIPFVSSSWSCLPALCVPAKARTHAC
jgi:hypothetical protein